MKKGHIKKSHPGRNTHGTYQGYSPDPNISGTSQKGGKKDRSQKHHAGHAPAK